MELETLRLVKQARKGDSDAFTRLMLANEQTLSRVAMSLLKNTEDAADAVQDTILAAWQSLDQLRQARYFNTWLVRILINKCYRISSLRNKHSHSQLEDALEHSPQPDWDEALDIRATLGNLKEEDRLILGLFYYDGLSVRDISKALEVSEECVKQRLHRGRKRFRTAYLKKEELCHDK
ncbi:MAG: RNA polymerase sigma factor [Acutalibacter sp.]|jgi:RNA polymerase sigma factor (sigma-70 family)